MQITFFGHSTVGIIIDDTRIITDPLLRRRIAFLTRVAPMPRHRPEPVDCVLLSHLHGDHADIASLRLLGMATRIIAPHDAVGFLESKGFTNVDAVREGDSVEVGNVEVRIVHAHHDSPWRPFVRECTPIGFVVEGTSSVYYPGDTDLFDGMSEIHDNLDVALLPIAGWGPSVGPGHLNEERAAQALELLRPRVAIPVHWGTFRPIGLHRAINRYTHHAAEKFETDVEAIQEDVDVRVLAPGDSYVESGGVGRTTDSLSF